MSRLGARAPIPSLLPQEKLNNDAVLYQLLKEIGLGEDDVRMDNEPLNAIVTDIDSLDGLNSFAPRYSIPDTVPIESPIEIPKETLGPIPDNVNTITLGVPDPLKPQRQLLSLCDAPIEASRQDKNLVTILPKPTQQGKPLVTWTAAASSTSRQLPPRPPHRFNAITEQEEKRYVFVFVRCSLDATKVMTSKNTVVFSISFLTILYFFI